MSALAHRVGTRDLEGMITTRVGVEILGPVPKEPVVVGSEVVRAGKRITLTRSTLSSEQGRTLAICNIWSMREGEVEPGHGTSPANPFNPPETLESSDFGFGKPPNYGSSVEVRFQRGGFLEEGPAQVWMRSRADLIEGSPRDPVEDVLCCVDSGSGVSRELSFDWIFINVELTLHLARKPLGGWIGMDAHTSLSSDGRGLAHSTLFDGDGFVGYCNQSLFVDPR